MENLTTIRENYGDTINKPIRRVSSGVGDRKVSATVLGVKPHYRTDEIGLDDMEHAVETSPRRICSVSNVLWTILVGWWVALFYAITGIAFFITIYGFRHGIYCFRMASFIFFPFGRYACRSESSKGPDNICTKILWVLFFPLWGIPCILGAIISWEFLYWIPMSKFMLSAMQLNFKQPSQVEILPLENMNPRKRPLLLVWTSGSRIYFGLSLMGFEVVYLNFWPFVVLTLLSGFVVKGEKGLGHPMFGSMSAMLGALPCAYIIGICVDELSHQLGLILGAILNSVFLTIVELILYYFSLEKNLASVVRSAVTGAFLMNLLIIPGVGMFAAGLKWNEVTLNRKSQSISGTFLLLAIVALLFPSVFYHVHSQQSMTCNQCSMDLTGSTNVSNVLCEQCTKAELTDYEIDPFYKKYAGPLMTFMSATLPIVYVLAVIFSLKTHKHIFEVPEVDNSGWASLNKWLAIIILVVATVTFSLMAHVMTDKIPSMIDSLGLSERFVGLVFYTLIPNAAEYMNSIKFALNGNIGLSMEIGNQGAILTAMIEMPALVLLSYVMRRIRDTQMFTLIFPIMDVFCVIVAVFLRNSILTEKSVNYLTGITFLIIFLLISVVYYFDVF